jgi:hypothetical protein
MAAESVDDFEEIGLANGDTLAERVEDLDLDAVDDDDTCTTDEMRDRLDL